VTRISSIVLSALLAGAALADGPAPAGSDAESFRERRAALAAKETTLSKADLARERYALGVWARDHAMPEEARACFQSALAADADHAPAREALGDVRLGDRWVPHAEAMAAKGLVLRGGSWILREEAAILDLPEQEKARRREGRTKVDQLLRTVASGNDTQRKFALQALEGVDDAFKVEPFAYALRSKSERVRLYAAQELGRLGDRRALKPLVRRAISDSSEDVRKASVESAKAIGDANLVAPFVRALGSDDAGARAHAAEALGRIGDVRAVQWLVWRLEAHGGTGQRVFSFFGNQLTYIQDFDVEVAQTAFIADPQVGVLQEGIVLDAQVHSLDRTMTWTERTAYDWALRTLTGATDVKPEPSAWLAWWKDHAKDYAASR
jgi:hypothetical protein